MHVNTNKAFATLIPEQKARGHQGAEAIAYAIGKPMSFFTLKLGKKA